MNQLFGLQHRKRDGSFCVLFLGGLWIIAYLCTTIRKSYAKKSKRKEWYGHLPRYA